VALYRQVARYRRYNVHTGGKGALRIAQDEKARFDSNSSRDYCLHGRLDITPQDANRVRAFSVGSRSKRPEIGRLASVITAPLPVGSDSSNSNKSSSAPLLSSSWGHNSGCSGASDRMEDLMELDFTRPSIPTTLSSPPSSCSQSQSQSYSTATDTSSYVDMSPGQPPVSTTAPYVDMSGINKVSYRWHRCRVSRASRRRRRLKKEISLRFRSIAITITIQSLPITIIVTCIYR